MKEKLSELMMSWDLMNIEHEEAVDEIEKVYSSFIEWLCSNIVFDLLAEKQYLVFTYDNSRIAMTLNEAFNYWWDNVKEKS